MLSESALQSLDECLQRLESLLPPVPVRMDWSVIPAAWWRRRTMSGALEPIEVLPTITLDDVLGVDRQKSLVLGNTRQFVRGLPANNVLLTGARGAGKSSLVQALLNRFYPEGLRVVQVERQDLRDLPAITESLKDQPFRFVVFCDDLSFDSHDEGYKALKSILDGAIGSSPDNILIYATSNRRHLMPEYASDNASYVTTESGELHPGEAVEEKISLSDRFGLWVSFQPMNQETYLAIARHWLDRYGAKHGVLWTDSARQSALRWALQRGTRSGRTASQFAKSWVGNALLQSDS
jgi:predicted AAA+ superfamily ATPase